MSFIIILINKQFVIVSSMCFIKIGNRFFMFEKRIYLAICFFILINVIFLAKINSLFRAFKHIIVLMKKCIKLQMHTFFQQDVIIDTTTVFGSHDFTCFFLTCVYLIFLLS